MRTGSYALAVPWGRAQAQRYACPDGAYRCEESLDMLTGPPNNVALRVAFLLTHVLLCLAVWPAGVPFS